MIFRGRSNSGAGSLRTDANPSCFRSGSVTMTPFRVCLVSSSRGQQTSASMWTDSAGAKKGFWFGRAVPFSADCRTNTRPGNQSGTSTIANPLRKKRVCRTILRSVAHNRTAGQIEEVPSGNSARYAILRAQPGQCLGNTEQNKDQCARPPAL